MSDVFIDLTGFQVDISPATQYRSVIPCIDTDRVLTPLTHPPVLEKQAPVRAMYCCETTGARITNTAPPIDKSYLKFIDGDYRRGGGRCVGDMSACST